MAPAKNPNTNCNSNQNSSSNNCSPNNNSNNAAATSSGAVPKKSVPPKTIATTTTTTKTATKRPAATLLQKQQQQQSSLSSPPPPQIFTLSSRCSPLNIVASMQQQQPQQQQQQRQLRKNTEIVAPIRRELNDLNDYLLSTVVTTAINNNNSNNNPQQSALNGVQQSKLQNSNNFNKQQHSQQQHFNDNNISANSSAGFDCDNIHETQRFCYPVRPIPRRNQQQQLQHQSQQHQSDNSTITLNNLNANLLNHAATTIGVVIPTTPGIVNAEAAVANNYNQQQQQQQQHQQLQLLLVQLQKLFDDQQQQQQLQQHNNSLPNNLVDLAARLAPPALTSTTTATAANIANSNFQTDNALSQRLQLLQHFLNLTAKPNSNTNYPTAAVGATAILPTTASSRIQKESNKQKSKMVHEINPSASENNVIVNSASLEDVALGEMGDNRAQSIQSLHSVLEIPTPDGTPSYQELQERLEASNRNISNMQEQQQQLLRLQNAAKLHLSEMEQLRQHAGQLSFGASAQQQNGGDAPEYESIDQVHSDMATLVGRMKNLTTFIQNQNELSNLLGDDGPDILAEQEALQRKLESLRIQRDEMRSLVGELQDINRTAEKSATESQQRENMLGEHEEKEATEVAEKKLSATTSNRSGVTATERVVPVEYTRLVPIELLQNGARPTQQHQAAEDEPEEGDPVTASLIQQKVADIEAMKSQLQRLKDMMETVNLIEAHTASRPDPKQVGRETRSQSSNASVDSSFDRERTPVAMSSNTLDADDNINNDDNPFIARKVRMLNAVTTDLRAQAASLQAERDRIKALKDEIQHRKEQAAAAAQLGEDALKRHSLTPTPTPLSRLQHEVSESQAERDQLKAEYETKKKEFELLCHRLQTEGEDANGATRVTRRHDIVSEADDEAEEELNDSDFGDTAKYFAAPSSATAPAPPRTSTSHSGTNMAAAAVHGKDSLDSTLASSTHAAANTTGAASATTAANSTHDGASLEAASMQSGSSRSFSIPPPMPAMLSSSNWPGPIPPPLPASWNPHFYYGATVAPPPLATVGPFTPPHLHSLHGVGPLPQAATTTAPHSSSECICSATNSAAIGGVANGGCAVGTASSSTSAAAGQLASDPMLLQQFVQTQQMVINSVCQCNQMLWVQQREIDTLNGIIYTLQERLLSLTGPSAADLAFNIRSESVPPPSLSGAMPNNLYTSANRASSEQPVAPFLQTASTSSQRSAFTNYHQQQQLHQQQQQHLFQQRQRGVITGAGAPGAAYNYSSETQQQQQNVATASSSMYSTLNNAAAAVQPQQFNNEAPQSPMAGPGPIFMHHHNNAIHQNNANLRTQNHHANNLQQHQQHHNNVTSGNTLNNQVPPGNRANNYWDNFRSYSRQNLLSTNSNKSNEEQQHNQQQHEHEEHYQPQRPAMTNLHHRQPPQQQQPQQATQQQPQPHLYQPQEMNNTACNNLNYESNNCSNKYLRALQRSRINILQSQQFQQQPQQQQQQNGNLYQQTNIPREYLENLNWQHDNIDDLFDSSYNIVDSDLSAANYAHSTTSSNLRNMNVNFGNSPHYQRNKVPAKPTATLTRSRLQAPLLRNFDDFSMASQQQQQHQPMPSQRQHFVNAAGNTQTLHNRERDYLLRIVDVAEDYAPPYVPNRRPSSLAAATAAENVAECFDDEDDTTSEEIKRNLLVNALKNDKFTTKFYESIKEDVFRRLESMLLEKESSDRQRTAQQQQQEQPTQQKQQFLTQLFNDVSGSRVDSSSPRDPMRKLFLNARMGNQQQRQQTPQQQQHALQQSSLQTLQHLELELDEEPEEDEEEQRNNADTESNNADNETNTMENIVETDIVENEKPEEDESEPTSNNDVSNVTDCEISAQNWRRSVNANVSRNTVQITSTRNSTKKRHKNQRRNDTTVDGGYSLAARQRDSTDNETQHRQPTVANNIVPTLPDYDLITYIIQRIKNQTHANTLINDTLLVEIAKLTATAAQNSATTKLAATTTTSPPPNISPKKIYAKMKKLIIPRQRDEFLVWYQRYLETLLLIEQHVANVGCKQQHELANRKLQKSNVPIANSENETEATKVFSINASATSLQDNDADLAEADQIGSANTSSNNSNILQQHDIEEVLADSITETLHAMDIKEENELLATNAAQLKHEIEEFENNENPDEEGACALLATQDTNLAMGGEDEAVADMQVAAPETKAIEEEYEQMLQQNLIKRNSVA